MTYYIFHNKIIAFEPIIDSIILFCIYLYIFSLSFEKVEITFVQYFNPWKLVYVIIWHNPTTKLQLPIYTVTNNSVISCLDLKCYQYLILNFSKIIKLHIFTMRWYNMNYWTYLQFNCLQKMYNHDHKWTIKWK